MSAGPGRIKGVVFREFVRWYEADLGSERLARAVASLSEQDRRVLDIARPQLGVVVSDWYPAGLAHRLLDAMTAGFDERALDRVALEGGRATVMATMRGLQKLAFELVMTPRRYQTYIQRIWNLNFDSGKTDVQAPEPNVHVGTIRTWRGHHPLICKMIVAAKPEIYRAMGCRHVQVRALGCICYGADACSSEVRWGVEHAPAWEPFAALRTPVRRGSGTWRAPGGSGPAARRSRVPALRGGEAA
jgi:hypothetical protein